jgi:hypothetical protein
MARTPKPKTYDSVVALFHRLEVSWDGGGGDAIATAFDGDEMLYLVVPRSGQTVPVWVASGSLSGAAVART